MKGYVKHAGAGLRFSAGFKFLPAAFLYFAAALTCAGVLTQTAARACKQRLLVEKQTPEQILKDAPACAEYLKSPAPYTYMQQPADLNLADVWKKVNSPVLVIYGTSDFLTSAAEHEYLRDMLNSFRPGAATYVPIEGMAHGFDRAASQRESLAGRGGDARPEFHTQVFDEILRRLTAAAT